MTNLLYFITPNDLALVSLFKLSLKLSVTILILCLNEEQAKEFQLAIPLEYAEIVFVFISEKTLIDYIVSERSP